MAKKRKANVLEDVEVKPELPPLVRDSDAPAPRKKKWINRQRVLIFGSRGLSFRERHLMQDLRTIMPHSKGESKKEKKDDIKIINEICEMKNCSKCIYFENRKKQDLYMWVSNVPQGPSVKFLVLNVHTMLELKLTGNCLKGSRPLLSFDVGFDTPHWQVIKELLVQVFSTPNHHPKSQPFHDHVMSFSVLDKKIWVRNYEVLAMDGKLAEIGDDDHLSGEQDRLAGKRRSEAAGPDNLLLNPLESERNRLVDVRDRLSDGSNCFTFNSDHSDGPRFVLDPIKIFEDSFGGATLWENPNFTNPNVVRRNQKSSDSVKYVNKLNQQQIKKVRPVHSHIGDPTNDVFITKPPEEAKGKEKNVFIRKRK